MPVAMHRAKPEMAAYLAQVGDEELPWTDVSGMRSLARRRSIEAQADPLPMASVEDARVGGVGVRVYLPTPGVVDAVVWVHGGGWIHGDLDGYDGVCRDLAAGASCAVVSVDYRLAPEFPFPAGLDDVSEVVAWASTRFEQVALAGDSSGGNLVAATVRRAREVAVEIAHQVLVYPVLDHADSDFKKRFRTEYEYFAGQHNFGREACNRIAWLWDQYDPGRRHRDEPMAAPMRDQDLAGLPSATLILAEHDVLRGEGEEYAEKLRAAGVAVRVETFPGQVHGFFQLSAVTPDARAAVDIAATEISNAFAGSASHQPTPTDDKENQTE